MGYQQVRLVQLQNYVPKEHTSASTLGKFIGCQRQWGFQKLLGLREEKERPWLSFGKEVEYYQQKYLEGYAIPQDQEAGRRALSSLHLLPDPKECIHLVHQEQVNIDTRLISPSIEPFQIQGAKDLLVFPLASLFQPGMNCWHLYDYKTTRGNTRKKGGEWEYAMTSQKLLDDIQGNWYAWDVFQNKGGNVLPARWVYTLTDTKKHPNAMATDAVFLLPQVKIKMQQFLEMADWHRSLARQYKQQPFDINGLRANPNTCDTFGGCPYRPAVGGPCKQPGHTIGAMMQSAIPGQPTDLETLLAAKRAEGMQAGGAPPPMAPPGYPQAPPAAPMMPPPSAYAPPPAAPMMPPGYPPPPQAMAAQAPPQAPAPGTRMNGHVWTGQAWVLDNQPPPPAPMQPSAPPAPHLPPEAYQPPQQPSAQPMAPPAPPQLPGMPPPAAAPAAPAKRGRKPSAQTSPGAPADMADETDERAKFMRMLAVSLPGPNSHQEIDQRAKLVVEYGNYLWQLLQHAGA